MLSTSQYTVPEFRPSSGRITYARWMGRTYIVNGEIVGERQIEVRRYKGVFVTEYLVKPSAGVTNLSKHVVNEADVVEIAICPDCGGHGYLSITGDEAVNCERCNPMGGEVVY